MLVRDELIRPEEQELLFSELLVLTFQKYFAKKVNSSVKVWKYGSAEFVHMIITF